MKKFFATREQESDSTWQFWKRRRHLVAFLAFFGFFNVYALRVNLSVAIVAMTSPYNVSTGNNTFEQVIIDCLSAPFSILCKPFQHVKVIGTCSPLIFLFITIPCFY